MATRNTDVYAKQIAPTMGNRNNRMLENAKLFFATAVYTMLGTEAAADAINIVKLPQGSVIVPHLCVLTGDGIATVATMKIGDDDVLGVGAAADDDRYAAALDIAASGSDLWTAATAGVAVQTPYTLGSDANIIGTFGATLTTPVAAKKICFRIAYLAPA